MILKQWRPVVGFEDLYEVSDHGDVRRLGSGCLSMNPTCDPHSGLRNRRTVVLYRKNRPHTCMVSHLVLRAFDSFEPTPRTPVQFKNGDRTDCRLVNLAWRIRPRGPLRLKMKRRWWHDASKRREAIERIACALLDKLDPQHIVLNQPVSDFVEAYTHAERMTEPSRSHSRGEMLCAQSRMAD